jgi:hypothetical protein
MSDQYAMDFGTKPVWTDKTTSNWTFFPYSDWMSTGSIYKVQRTLRMEENSGLMKVRASYQTSDDKLNVDTPGQIGSAITSEGISQGTLVTMSTVLDGDRYVRFGVQTTNNSGTQLECANVGYTITVQTS